jgi:hypothetical protein
MTWVPGLLATAGPWALAVATWAGVAWLIIDRRVVPRSHHRELIELYEKRATQDAATITELRAQVGELLEHSRLAVQTWEALKREAERPEGAR